MDMTKKGLCLILAAALAVGCLAGCGGASAPAETIAETIATEPAPWTPADGNLADVTCKGTYTQQDPQGDTVVARVGQQTLTNGMLWACYWLEVAAYRQSAAEIAPDFDVPLDQQPCQLDSTVNSWQQYFLRRALNTWHTAQALVQKSQKEGIPTEEAYARPEGYMEKYLTDCPAVEYLYGTNNNYRVNTLHQAWLDALPQTLDTLAQGAGLTDGKALNRAVTGSDGGDLAGWAALYNTGYAYFTALTYLVDPTQEEQDAWEAENPVPAAGETLVTIRQIQLVPQVPEPVVKKSWEPTEATVDPLTLETVTVAEDGTVSCSQAMWDLGLEQAQDVLAEYEAAWNKNLHSNSRTDRESMFANYAHSRSVDTDTAPNGGLYRNLRRGQLTKELDDWCFDSSREAGDITILRTAQGYHIVYFVEATDTARLQWEGDYRGQLLAETLEAVRKAYPMSVTYSNIALTEVGETTLLTNDGLLYADVGHERFPEVPVYLQQDYPKSKYGAYPLRTHGCGITTMAMISTYLSDNQHTPPELATRYGNYCFSNGTDGSLFTVTPSEMGFYLRYQTQDPMEAKAALEAGYLVVCLQIKGYWTKGGHYLCLEKLVDDPEGGEEKLVQVRDSNIFNYWKLKGHHIDAHQWSTIPPNANSYWVFEKKNVTNGICDRCGDPTPATAHRLTGGYTCEKCETAQTRRNAYLAG